jgi:hypothetical protein
MRLTCGEGRAPAARVHHNMEILSFIIHRNVGTWQQATGIAKEIRSQGSPCRKFAFFCMGFPHHLLPSTQPDARPQIPRHGTILRGRRGAPWPARTAHTNIAPTWENSAAEISASVGSLRYISVSAGILSSRLAGNLAGNKTARLPPDRKSFLVIYSFLGTNIS